MSQRADIVVVGAGPAGVSAALELAALGRSVLLVEQRDKAGGAIHRQPAPGKSPVGLGHHARVWRDLAARLAAEPRIHTAYRTVFIGLDGDGLVLLDDRAAGVTRGIEANGLLIATGAIEQVHPFEGWDLPGVMTVGGAQVLLKETGAPPPGPILIAGSGALLYAAAAQLSAAGARILGVLERGRPLGFPALRMLAWPRLSWEALGYLARTVPLGLRFGTHVVAARPAADGLVVTCSNGRTLRPRTLLVHDGIAADPLLHQDWAAPFPVETAGDGREVLGSDAMLHEGRSAARRLARRMGIEVAEPASDDRPRRFQALLGALFAHELPAPSAATVLCRCEGQSFGDLAALPHGLSPREIRLSGRMGMGSCQGRFCARHIPAAGASGSDDFRPSMPRWPLRPVALASLARAPTNQQTPRSDET